MRFKGGRFDRWLSTILKFSNKARATLRYLLSLARNVLRNSELVTAVNLKRKDSVPSFLACLPSTSPQCSPHLLVLTFRCFVLALFSTSLTLQDHEDSLTFRNLFPSSRKIGRYDLELG